MSKKHNFACFLFFIFLAIPCFAQENIPVKVKAGFEQSMTLGASSQGYEFYIAIPPNESSSFLYYPELLAIYVTSTKPTDVTVEYGSSRQLIKKKRINVPFGTVSFTNYANELSFKTYEMRIPETVREQGIRITSTDNPVSVYVMNSKNTTSDGYMAIPTSSWGTDYIHCSYYDNSEGTDAVQGLQYFGGGFIICGGNDNTTVNITLKGKGAGFSTTTSGHEIGDNWSINLGAGQTYLVQGKANTDGMFDLTGSSIKSDKPIGLISYHQRADLPALIGSSRDHLCEMLPPVQAWGKKYASIEYKRNNKGDLFRLVASEDDTKYKIIWFDMNNNDTLGVREGTLKKAGNFAEVSEILSHPSGQTSIRGVSIFEADKPILVMQYSYSSSWDFANNFDPFMIVVSSVEQFTKATVFVTPDREFADNKFNIIAVGDTSDQVRHDLLIKSIELDGKPLWLQDPSIIRNQIPGTDLFWGRVANLEIGPHYIVSSTPFGGYVYGFTSVDSYGWPAAMSINEKSSNDKTQPLATVSNINNNNFLISYSDNATENETGVSLKPTLIYNSNFEQPKFEKEFATYPPTFNGNFSLKVADPSKNAKAIYLIADRAGNEFIDSISFNAIGLNKIKLVSPINDAINTNRNLSFAWSDEGLNYKFKISNNIQDLYNEDFTYHLLETNSVNHPFTLDPGTKYYWMVAPTYSNNVQASDIWSFTTTSNLGTVVLEKPFNKEFLSTLKPSFKWNNLELQKYTVEISENYNFTEASQFETNENSFILQNELKEGMKYYWRVKGKFNELSTISEIFEFSTPTIGSVNTLNDKTLTSHENNKLIIQSISDDTTIEFISCFNINGERIAFKDISHLNTKLLINTKDLPNSIYLINVLVGGEPHVIKFVVVN